MKIKQPEPFTFEAGPRAVLLLHGFTGHSADVRMLGRYLEKKGYTTHAPIYRGHGRPPEEIVKYNPDDWWEDVLAAYRHLQELGYQEIAVAGLSLGGVFSLKLACNEKIKGVIPMCAPMYFDNESQLKIGFRAFTKEYKQLSGGNGASVEEEVNALMDKTTDLFKQNGQLIKSVNENLDLIYVPAFVVQARKDQMINTESANHIYDNISSTEKDIKWYEESGHVITLGKEKEQLHEDVYNFLESLDWGV